MLIWLDGAVVLLSASFLISVLVTFMSINSAFLAISRIRECLKLTMSG